MIDKIVEFYPRFACPLSPTSGGARGGDGDGGAADPVAQSRSGLPAAVLLIVSLMLKMAVWPSLQTNRLQREMKLIQLHLARRGGDEPPRAGR